MFLQSFLWDPNALPLDNLGETRRSEVPRTSDHANRDNPLHSVRLDSPDDDSTPVCPAGYAGCLARCWVCLDTWCGSGGDGDV